MTKSKRQKLEKWVSGSPINFHMKKKIVPFFLRLAPLIYYSGNSIASRLNIS